ncbi:transposase [Pseudonocardia sp. ICBG601]|uniref:transposase n=1 Tax=Pseudonocardia sp. ICBG601 TaxID=2846759 RepID=UPI001CF6879D
MSIILTPGQAGDNPHLLPLLDQIRVGRDGPGRPRQRPDRVLADKAYSHPSTRAALRERGIAFTSPEKRPTRSPAAPRKAPAADARPRSTRAFTSTATSSSGVSTGSSRSATWPPATPMRRLLPIRDHHRRDRVMAAHRLTGHGLDRHVFAGAYRRGRRPAYLSTLGASSRPRLQSSVLTGEALTGPGLDDAAWSRSVVDGNGSSCHVM